MKRWMNRVVAAMALAALCVALAPARQREPNNVYAERRARLRALVDEPVVLFGYTGAEDASPSYIFGQEHNFYYLTGHNEEGAALVLLPERGANGAAEGPREFLYLPQRTDQFTARQRWDGPRLAAGDANITERTGFAVTLPFPELKAKIGELSKQYTNFYTLLPGRGERGYPHAGNWQKWLLEAAPGANLREVRGLVNKLRMVKSPSELALITRATELSMDAHLEAWRMIRPGVWEYEVAARMRYIYGRGGCERDAYAPIVGTGFNSTVLHYNKVDAQIQDGDLVLMDVGCEFSGYATDITRTVPASGKFTARQREIYDIVLAAADAAIAAVKPGAQMSGQGSDTLTRIAQGVINSRGKDKQGNSLGRYFIHGLGHQVGLSVHDPAEPGRALEPGMVFTIEPGIYIPEENLGVRIEDMVLVTETGAKLLTARLPRKADEIEKFMADARKKGARD
ncbi:MAG TPA: Xaa-Pro peptidase family protein [Candidatus Nitrosotenuis sp.]|nr:Xaa-Pro peptidase family protein [Candidatus Nitrosotenuis sp.]